MTRSNYGSIIGTTNRNAATCTSNPLIPSPFVKSQNYSSLKTTGILTRNLLDLKNSYVRYKFYSDFCSALYASTTITG
jgi:hypothetical protein